MDKRAQVIRDTIERSETIRLFERIGDDLRLFGGGLAVASALLSWPVWASGRDGRVGWLLAAWGLAGAASLGAWYARRYAKAALALQALVGDDAVRGSGKGLGVYTSTPTGP